MLCLAFLINGARQGEPGLLVSLEEPVEQILSNARSIAPDVDDLVQSHTLKILTMSPLETDINEQIVLVREQVGAGGVKRLAFDALSNYVDVLPELEYKDYVYALLSFIRTSGVTSLFVEDIRQLTEVQMVTSYGTSYLLDNIIMLRFVEVANELRRAIVVLKTRGSDHARDIREYVITGQGLEILPIDPGISVPVLSLQQYSHILTGFPVPREEGAPRGTGRRSTRPPES